jgi:Galactose oxidase, central domain
MRPARYFWSARKVALLVLPLSMVLLFLVTPDAVSASTVQRSDFPTNTWVPTAGSMSVARSGQSEVPLHNGKVLIVGGHSAAAELYNPSTEKFSPTGSMSMARPSASITLLGDGEVLVAGGCCTSGDDNFSSAELYNPATGIWSLTGSMVHPRSEQTATLLPDGMVLVAGGLCNGNGNECDSGSFLENQKTAELYDPDAGRWTATASMIEGRALATATLLADGEVLVAGGFNNCDDDFCSDLNEAELYNPQLGAWTKTGSFKGARELQTATLLGDGSVLLAGGLNLGGFSGKERVYSSATIYDPTTGKWTTTASMPGAHYGQIADTLDNGWVLVAGGQSATAEIYEVGRRVWVEPGAMSTSRTFAASAVLPDGDVLVSGGLGPDHRAQPTAELFLAGHGPLVSVRPDSLYFGSQLVGTTGSSRSYTVFNYGDSPLAVSGVTVSGTDPGDFTASDNCTGAPLVPGASCQVSARFTPGYTGVRTATVSVVDDAPRSPQAVATRGVGEGPNAFSPTGSMAVGRMGSTATLLGDGDVLIAGGESNTEGPLSECELYDPTTQSFSMTGSLNIARAFPTAALLPDGEVLIAGGKGVNFDNLKSAELYDPSTGASTMTAPMMGPGGFGITSTLLGDGEVLVDGIEATISAELYNPSSGTWTDTGPTVATDYDAKAVLLGDGDVLIVGDGTTEASLYDPTTNAWTMTGSMNVARAEPTATLLETGEVLVAGGSPPNDGAALTSAELYNPALGTWAMTQPLPSGRSAAKATLLPDGVVLIAGGCMSDCGPTKTTTIVYEAGYFEYGPPMIRVQLYGAGVLLANGDFLIAGGEPVKCCGVLSAAEIYTSTVAKVKPAQGPPGQMITVRGSGYYAGELVDLTIDSVASIGEVRTSSFGTFDLRTTIPSNEPVGSHTIQAVGRRSFATGQTSFTVT